MIHRANELESFEKEMFGGPGAVHFTKIVPAEGDAPFSAQLSLLDGLYA